jgi:hypothetical protein
MISRTGEVGEDKNSGRGRGAGMIPGKLLVESAGRGGNHLSCAQSPRADGPHLVRREVGSILLELAEV